MVVENPSSSAGRVQVSIESASSSRQNYGLDPVLHCRWSHPFDWNRGVSSEVVRPIPHTAAMLVMSRRQPRSRNTGINSEQKLSGVSRPILRSEARHTTSMMR